MFSLLTGFMIFFTIVLLILRSQIFFTLSNLSRDVTLAEMTLGEALHYHGYFSYRFQWLFRVKVASHFEKGLILKL